MSSTQVRTPINEESVAVAVGYVLRAGVYTSAFLILLGVVLELVYGGGMAISTEAPRAFSDVRTALAARQPLGVIELGVLVLLATPWIRVAISFLLFLHLRDRIYSLISLALLLLLTVGLVLGRG